MKEPPLWVNKRMVRILLECILVFECPSPPCCLDIVLFPDLNPQTNSVQYPGNTF